MSWALSLGFGPGPTARERLARHTVTIVKVDLPVYQTTSLTFQALISVVAKVLGFTAQST